jgi:hypothetical protein
MRATICVDVTRKDEIALWRPGSLVGASGSRSFRRTQAVVAA